ncbi:hypothetical protein [Roseomonas marmotae]|uniref:PRC-barrel domain containing protein n=1 Tax=Roseomonas marmotae TaxID=2768161 RepID=A0ABS3KEM8_9PROT|nr:hypothetical protein [Roseomonas marmotae]MBO1075914.1 hypothetical protein [Roseomonas marmotae]QTI81903.1 hypothetical protein IAI58_21430 [Roseomonas marmotae]
MATRSLLSRLSLAAACLGMTIPGLAAAQDAPVVPPISQAPAPQPPAQQPPAPQPPPLPPAAQEKLDKSAVPLLGRDVKGPSGMVVAQFVNVLVDPAGRAVGAVLDYGGFLGVGKRRIAVAWRCLSFQADGIQLSLGREQLRDVPDFKDGEPAVMAAPPEAGQAEPPEEAPGKE